jgi:hypothetical protein
MARQSPLQTKLEEEKVKGLVLLTAHDEELIYLARTMRDGGLPEEAWFVFADLLELISDVRFDDSHLEHYAPGHRRRWRAAARKLGPNFGWDEVKDSPEMIELDREFCAAKDRFTRDLFALYGLAEVGDLWVRDRPEYERRVKASLDFHGRRRHHFATSGICRTGSPCGKPQRVRGYCVWWPDLPPFRQWAEVAA